MKLGKAKTMKKHLSMLFGEKAELMKGSRTKRMHIYVDENSNNKVRYEAEKLGISISDYIVYTTLFFKTKDIPEKLDKTLNKLNKLLKEQPKQTTKFNKNVMKELANQYKEGSNVMVTEKRNKKKEEGKTKQFHLRVTQEAYEEIKKRAATFSMSISDYVVFVTLHFDVMEISKKIDTINAKIDTLTTDKDEVNSEVNS